jgi:AraC-like DNA-binding protein
LLKVLERAGRQALAPVPKKRDLARDVREFATERLTKGPIRIDDVARDLGMSSKTLERRLADEGTIFT